MPHFRPQGGWPILSRFLRKGGASTLSLASFRIWRTIANLHRRDLHLADPNRTPLADRMVTVAAPGPYLWFGYQPLGHRITVHIPQLLHVLVFCPDGKIT